MRASYLSQILLDRTSNDPPAGFDSVRTAPPGASAELDKRVCHELTQQLRLQVRYSFSLVSEFRTQQAAGATTARLAYLLRAILQVTRATFSIATMARVVDKQTAAERALCVSDLEQLLNALLAETLPAPYDLAHGMDALIIHLVQLTHAPASDDSAYPDRDPGALPRR